MNFIRDLSQHFRQLGNYLLPTQCLLCDSGLSGDLLCYGCLYDLPWLNRYSSRCQQCAIALSSAGEFCGHCVKQPPAFSRCLIPFAYQQPLTPLIQRFKYRRKLASGKMLGQQLAQYLQNCATEPEWQQPDLIIPTPMHWRRRWQRGFNQAEVLGHYLAAATGIAMNTQLVLRQKHTPSQKELTRDARQKNLRHAFCLAPHAAEHIKDKRIALVDDVVTTTATVRELSRLLIKAGALDVQIWALARTLDH